MAKPLSIAQISRKRFRMLEGLSQQFIAAHGELEDRFTACIYGDSGMGKTNYLMQFVSQLLDVLPRERCLYVSLEEGHGKAILNTLLRQDMAKYNSRLLIMDHCNYDELMEKLNRRRSPKVVVLDSVQYLNLSWDQYVKLKESHPNKIILFISHSKGKKARGSTAEGIVYDANIKVRVEGFKALVTSRFGGTENFIIWEDGAKKYWGAKKFKHFHSR
jgi:Cdc6-like AAA superfamily ATPase